jgi:hypothetical protein
MTLDQLARFLPAPEYKDPTIPKLLENCLQKAGTKPGWRSLYRHTLVNGAPLPQTVKPPKNNFWELGHIFQQKADHIVWIGLTVDGGEHCNNHVAKIFPD